MPRTNLRDQFTSQQRAEFEPKIICRNTFRYTRGKDIVIRLHATDIVVKHPDGSVTLNSGGWKTVTTKDRMSAHMPAGYHLYSDKGQWYVSYGLPWCQPKDQVKRVPYFDGIRVPQCFKGSQAKAAAAEKRETKLRDQIKKFVSKLDKLDKLPEPNNGDCWFCHLVNSKGKTMGELSHSDHIMSHIREGYLHGSLIWNALEWAGHRQPEFIWSMANYDIEHGRSNSCLRSIKRALKRYLYRQCGLVS